METISQEFTQQEAGTRSGNPDAVGEVLADRGRVGRPSHRRERRHGGLDVDGMALEPTAESFFLMTELIGLAVLLPAYLLPAI